MKLILASASPRRAQLLRDADIKFSVQVSPLKEASRKPAGIAVDLWPMCLAHAKAAAIWNGLTRKDQSSTVVLGADTIVVLDDKNRPLILNKARHRSDARRMLQKLSRKTHRVITGICLLSIHGPRLLSAQAQCRIHFSPKNLEAYLDSGLWKGKAGAYGIQDNHDPFVTLLNGDATTVIGLPVPLVKRELTSLLKEDAWA